MSTKKYEKNQMFAVHCLASKRVSVRLRALKLKKVIKNGLQAR
jgi:hypothetical protein